MNWKSILGSPKIKAKIKKTMHEFKNGKLTARRNGPTVKTRSQALAIALDRARKLAGVK